MRPLPAPSKGIVMNDGRVRNRRGPRPAPPIPRDAAVEDLIDAIHTLNEIDRVDREWAAKRRPLRAQLIRDLTRCVNHQREANGRGPLSDADKAAIVPALLAVA